MSDSRSGYEEIDIIHDVDGVAAVITRRRGPSVLPQSRYSFMLAKVFDRDGTPDRTSFVQTRHIAGLLRLLPLIQDRIEQLVDQEKAAERKDAEERKMRQQAGKR